MPVNETTERIIFEGVDKITAASKSAQASTKALKDTIAGVKDAMGALGITAAAGVFIRLQLDALHATAALDDMAEATGASVEKLSAIQRVAKVGGQDFEGLTGQMGRMVKGLKDGSEEGGKAAHALEFLGVKAKDANGNFRDTGQVLIDAARALDKFRDDGNKVALIQDILGKGAERYAPLLKDIAQGTDLVSKVTAEQAAKAEEAEKNINRLKVSMEDARREMVKEFTPGIIEYTNRVLAAKEGTKGWYETIERLLSVSGDQAKNPIAALEDIDQRLVKLHAFRDVLAGPGIGAAFNRMMAPEDLSTVNQQIGLAERQRSVLLELMKRTTFKNMEGMVEDPAGIHPAPDKPRSGYVGDDREGATKRDRLSMLIARNTLEDEERLAQERAALDKYVTDGVVKSLDEQNTAYSNSALLRQKRQEDYETAQTEAVDRETQRVREAAAADYAAFLQRNTSEEELENQRFQHSVDLLGQTVHDQEQYQQIYEAMYAEHQNRLVGIQDAAAAKRYGISKIYRDLDVGATKTFFGTMSLLMQTKNKELFEIGKVAAIAGTVVNTYEMAVKSYNALASIPYVGPALGAAAAGAAIAFGMAQVAAIKSQSFGGGGAGGGAAAVPTFAASPSTGLPAGTPGDVGGSAQKTIIVKIIGEGERFTIDQVRQLAEAIADNSEGGVVIS